MRIGLTYDLREDYLAAGYGELETAEFDRADTIDALEDALRQLGHQPDRIGHARQLIGRLSVGDRWDLVFNICEGMYGAGREAQVPAILDVFNIPYTFADPCVMAVCLNKSLTKTVVREAGLPTPRSAVVEEMPASGDLAPADNAGPLRYPLFAKPLAEGTGKGVTPASLISTSRELTETCAELLAFYKQPVLVEEYLPGREFTVGVLGTGTDARVIGTLEIILKAEAEQGVYSYKNKEECEELVEYRRVDAAQDSVVAEAERITLAAWQALHGRDGGRLDLRCDASGQPQFIEANPLAGLHPWHSDLPMLAMAVGMSYVELIGAIVDSAGERVSQNGGTSRSLAAR